MTKWTALYRDNPVGVVKAQRNAQAWQKRAINGKVDNATPRQSSAVYQIPAQCLEDGTNVLSLTKWTAPRRDNSRRCSQSPAHCRKHGKNALSMAKQTVPRRDNPRRCTKYRHTASRMVRTCCPWQSGQRYAVTTPVCAVKARRTAASMALARYTRQSRHRHDTTTPGSTAQ